MTDNQTEMLKDDAENIKEAAPKLGALLKEARETQGLSIEQIAEQLHLRPSIVSDIEADDYSNIASATYVKGYVKNYARIVSLDKEVVNAALAQYFPVADSPTMQSFSRKTTRQARDGWLMMVTYFIIFTLLALLVVWWLQKSEMMSGVDLSKLTVEEVAEIETDEARPALFDKSTEPAEGSLEAETGVELQVLTESSGLNQAQESSANTVDEQPTATNPSSESDASEGNGSAVAMKLAGDCWIKLTDALGNTLVDGLKVAGSELNVVGQEPFNIILGAPQSLELSINGESVDLTKYPKGRVARLTLTSSTNL
ncbi:RodZ domain-containing protein [Shewanella psychrotolerans]|uniref:RodZ domain-containing protein n=1 Tax=Shewanella psychrotolerans TaxID=2864206 RepID=UPI001C65B042|nr:RodZ domain-containing protein [Shewanella psychrotolerans]QYK02476.1 DUF4115 domain-containing protein [Shewanella psychrotolerans]